MKETILVTGGAGFIGSHVAEILSKNKHKVVILDDLSGGFLENIAPNALFEKGSVCDKKKIEALFAKYPFKLVYHIAAYAAEGLSHFIRRYNYTNNLLGSINLINASVKHHVRCLVFTSSIAVYGSGQTPFKEDTIPLPEDPYGIAKYAVELDLRNARRLFGLNYVIFRPHNVYGPRQNLSDPYRNVIGIFMNRCMAGQAMPVFGDGTQTRAFTYIDDVALPIAEAGFMPETYGEIFNIGSDRRYSVGEIARLTAEAMGRSCNINYQPTRHETLHAYASHDKSLKYFGRFMSHTPLEVGLKHMAAWAKTRRLRRPKAFAAIEIEKQLPTIWRNLSVEAKRK